MPVACGSSGGCMVMRSENADPNALKSRYKVGANINQLFRLFFFLSLPSRSSCLLSTKKVVLCAASCTVRG